MKSKENKISPEELLEVVEEFGLNDIAKNIIFTLELKIDNEGMLMGESISQIQNLLLANFQSNQLGNTDLAVQKFVKFLGKYDGALQVQMLNEVRFINNDVIEDCHKSNVMLYILNFNGLLKKLYLQYEVQIIDWLLKPESKRENYTNFVRKIFLQLDWSRYPRSSKQEESEFILANFIGLVDVVDSGLYTSQLIDYIKDNLAIDIVAEDQKEHFDFYMIYIRGLLGKLTKNEFESYYSKLQGKVSYLDKLYFLNYLIVGAITSSIDVAGYTQDKSLLFINEIFQQRMLEAQEVFESIEGELRGFLIKFWEYCDVCAKEVIRYNGILEHYQELLRLIWLMDSISFFTDKEGDEIAEKTYI